MDSRRYKSINKFKYSKIWAFLAVFFLPVALLIIGFMVQHVYPFGNNTLIRSDFNAQYVNYFVYFKEHFGNLNAFIYSNQMALGGNMVGLTAYYLMSPFNLIFLFFSVKNISVAIMLISLIKIGLCGVTMYLFLNYFVSRNYHKTFINKRLFLVVLATSYALSAYPMGYLLNIMWLDGVYTLPLIILGIEKIIDNKQPYIYVIALSYGLLTNYYIGYMLCIFSGIYAIYRFTEKWLEKKKISLKQMLKYIIGSFVSVGLSAVVLIPSLLSLGGVKSTQYKFTITPSYPLSHFVIQLLNGTLKYNTNDYLIAGPMVYTGLLVLVVMFFYFINESVPFRFRLLDLGLLLVMVTGSYISGFDKIWHGFNAPEGVPNRYAFIFSFLFLYLAAKNFKHIERVTTFKTLIAAIVFIILICLLYIKHSSIMPLKLVLYNMLLS